MNNAPEPCLHILHIHTFHAKFIVFTAKLMISLPKSLRRTEVLVLKSSGSKILFKSEHFKLQPVSCHMPFPFGIMK